jgi:predicted patatin/cPLA2 family phospholipase
MGLTTNVDGCALVFEGGGYRAGYTAGMATALLEQGIYFPFACGISAGASNTVNYLTRDKGRARWAFVDLAGDPEAGGRRTALQGKGYINGDYCYRGVIEQGIVPFDWETFAANPARMRLQAFERDTGRTVVFTKKEMPDVWELLRRVRASSTLPVMMPPSPVDDRVLLDGGLGEGAGIPVHLAEKAGYERFFFVSTRPDGYRKKPPTERERAMFLRMGKNRPYLRNALLTRSERYNAELDRLAGLEREGRLMWVRPDFMPVRSTTIDPLELEQAYKMGHAQAEREMDRWTDFLFGGNA